MGSLIIRNMRLILRKHSNCIVSKSVCVDHPLTRYYTTTTTLLKKEAPPAAAMVKKGPTLEKAKLPVETDPEKLINYVCGLDYRKENAEDVKIKDDSEYPDWLWEVRLGKPTPLEEMDQNSKQYWRRTFDHLRRYRARVKKMQKIKF